MPKLTKIRSIIFLRMADFFIKLPYRKERRRVYFKIHFRVNFLTASMLIKILNAREIKLRIVCNYNVWQFLYQILNTFRTVFFN